MSNRVSALKNKSEINLEAAKMLNENFLSAPGAHCAYYSVLQLMKFAVSNSIGISYEMQEQEINALKTQKASAKGTHEYLIMKVGEVIYDVDRHNFADFSRNVKDLKNSELNLIMMMLKFPLNKVTKLMV